MFLMRVRGAKIAIFIRVLKTFTNAQEVLVGIYGFITIFSAVISIEAARHVNSNLFAAGRQTAATSSSRETYFRSNIKASPKFHKSPYVQTVSRQHCSKIIALMR